MTSLDFSLSYPYRYDAAGSLTPLLPMQLVLPPDYAAEFLALVDTGAERTLLEGIHLRAAGIDVFSGKPLTFQGFLGARTVAYLHRVQLTIGPSQIELEVAFSTQPLLRPVMGRDLMAYFGLALRERASQFFLEPES